MLKLWLALFSALLGIAPAQAQVNFTMPPPSGVSVGGVMVVTTCGMVNLTNGSLAYLAMDHTGALCTNASGGGGGGGLSVVDGAGFTASTSPFTPGGGEYASSPTLCADGKQCMVAITTQRAYTVDTPISNNNLYTAITSPIVAGTNHIGSVTPEPTAGAGCVPYHLSGGTTASTNSHSIKASAVGTVCRWTLVSTSGTLAYLKVYDSAGAPTCSSATGLVHIYPIPASTSGGGLQVLDNLGEAYANGIGYCVTGGGGDTDNTNAPTGVYIEASYK